MNSVEKKPYDQEKAAFLVTVSSTDSQMWAICITALGKVTEEAEFMMNKLDIAAQRQRRLRFLFPFFWRGAPSQCLQDQTTCCSCINSNKIKESSVTSITSQVVALALPQP